jgi:hypothetical protein
VSTLTVADIGERAPFRLDDRGVVTRATNDPGRQREVCLDPGDKRALSDVSDRERVQPGPAQRGSAG